MEELVSGRPLDGFDRHILRLVQEDARMPLRQIAEAVSLSTAAVQRRLRRLELEGVIMGTVAVIDPAKVERPLTILVEVSVANERLELIDAMSANFLARPEVQQCYYVTGEYDFALVILVRDMPEYERLTRELFFEDNNVVKFRTTVAMRRLRIGATVPI